MKPFNLAEARIVERNYCQEHISKRMMMIGLTIIATVVVAGASLLCKSMFSGTVQETKSRLADVQGRHVRIKREMSLINNKISERKWQDQLAGQSCKWLGIMDAAMESVPPDVWLDSIKNSDAESSLAISGKASSLDAVTTFTASLRSRSQFGDVRLESAKMDGSTTAACVDFILTITLKDASGASTNTATAGGAPAAAQPSSAPVTTETPATPGKVPDVQGST